MQMLHFRVPTSCNGMRLNIFLRTMGVSSACIKAVKYQGTGFCVRLGDEVIPVHTDYRVATAQIVSFALPPEPPTAVQPEPLPIDVIYEDEFAAVLNKPAGIAVHPTLNHTSGTLANGWLYRLKCRGEMAYAGANHLERLDDILAQGNDAESKRADDCDKQTDCVHANGRSNFVSTAHSANHGILDPKADHVQGIANQVRVRNTRQYLTEAVTAAGFFCSAPPGVYGQLAAQAVQPEGKTAVSTDRRCRCFILLFSLILLFQMGRICAQKGLLSARKGACMGL